METKCLRCKDGSGSNGKNLMNYSSVHANHLCKDCGTKVTLAVLAVLQKKTTSDAKS